MATGIVSMERNDGGTSLVDSSSTVSFKIGCDANGVYIVTPDENNNSNNGEANNNE